MCWPDQKKLAVVFSIILFVPIIFFSNPFAYFIFVKYFLLLPLVSYANLLTDFLFQMSKRTLVSLEFVFRALNTWTRSTLMLEWVNGLVSGTFVWFLKTGELIMYSLTLP